MKNPQRPCHWHKSKCPLDALQPCGCGWSTRTHTQVPTHLSPAWPHTVQGTQSQTAPHPLSATGCARALTPQARVVRQPGKPRGSGALRNRGGVGVEGARRGPRGAGSGLEIWGVGFNLRLSPPLGAGGRYQMKTVSWALLGAAAQSLVHGALGQYSGFARSLTIYKLPCRLQTALFATLPRTVDLCLSLYAPTICYAPLHFSPPCRASPNTVDAQSENLLVSISAPSSPPRPMGKIKLRCSAPCLAPTSPRGLSHPFPVPSAAPSPPPGCPGASQFVPLCPSISSHPG